ncbi:tetratricopeptide repeat protein [Streptomyces stelliscabiei]|uniref:tetratricopeptide repeat protein n=1 Tax=Streptomyces stelliscabiei TaxID=146820 RepID=UPI0029B20126|nr:tetratricopeptide repeat protein [Streptomyces stelliscabiei]MDX2557950.1 tetratricopeptide repeat protein [Streptomyces stelliscabiei]MDX2613301.1 tetratricopeptide repeat protein [Streptomyces stelliscabiei]MDX2638423.1 tetratricopeptide repeat protein [Streptomyces stelliscabiei]MDX2661575.1 tetratricopeptide repeat protein [Streptomyces stelliscabiei]MDX2712292.1 tetratricopeptide repeat protein [Streptomyces stelliscabiei]
MDEADSLSTGHQGGFMREVHPHRSRSAALGRFVGRQEELAAFAEILAAAERKQMSMLIIAGEAGIGKTALLEEFARSTPSGWRSSYLRLGDSLDEHVARIAPAGLDLPGQIVHDLGEALLQWTPWWRRRKARRRFNTTMSEAIALVSSGSVNITQEVSGASSISDSPITVVSASSSTHRAYREALLRAVTTVARTVSQRRGVLLLDNADWLTFLDDALLEQNSSVAGSGSGGVGAWFIHRVLMRLRQAAPRVAVVLAGRTRLDPPRDVIETRVMELPRFTEAQTNAFLALCGVKHHMLAQRVHAAFGGHPMWTAMAAQTMSGHDSEEIPPASVEGSAPKWLIDMFLSRLTSQQRAIMRAAALCRSEITRGLLVHMMSDQTASGDWFEVLTRHCFLKPLDNAGLRWEFDSLIRSALLEHFEDPAYGGIDESSALDEMHARAVEYFTARGSFSDEVYHLLALGDDTRCGEWRSRIQLAYDRGDFAQVLAYASLATTPEQTRRISPRLPEVLAFALHRTADVARIFLQLEAAVPAYLGAARLYHGVSDTAGQAAVFASLGPILHSLGDFRGAESYLRRALELYRKIGDIKGQANVLQIQGAWARQRGQLKGAEKNLRASLKLFEKANDRVGESLALYELGNTLRNRGDLIRAREAHQRSLDVSRAVGNQRGQADALYALGGITYELGRIDQAENHYHQALKIYQRLRDVKGQADALHGLGSVERSRNDIDQAAHYLRRALALSEEAGFLDSEASARHELGVVALINNDLESAYTELTRAAYLFEEGQHPIGASAALLSLGTLARRREQYDLCTDYQNRAMKLSRSAGDVRGQAGASYELGCVARVRGDLLSAEKYLLDALKLYQRIGHIVGQGGVHAELGTLAADRSQRAAAINHLERSIALFQSASDMHNLSVVAKELERLYAQSE